jgi:bifunctional oligoribonuclease and PAP phosphatase NrnA
MSKSNSREGSARWEIARRLSAARSIVLVTHDRPDGDAMGSMMALTLALRRQGKTALPTCCEPMPRRYAFLTEGEEFLDASAFASQVQAADCILVLDTSATRQLVPVAGAMAAVKDKVLVIDHHQTREDIAAVCWSDESAAAVGVLAAELFDELGWPMDAAIARAVMTAVCTDTGWMQYSNTDPRALGVVSRCLAAGVAADELYRTLFQNDRPQRLALLGRMLAGLALHMDGRLALMIATRDDFQRTGAGNDETENLVNEPMRIAGVCVSLLLVEQDGGIRGSLRSKAHVDAGAGGRVVDVAAVAQQFGGGGHARAAGFRMECSLEEAKGKVLEVLQRAF